MSFKERVLCFVSLQNMTKNSWARLDKSCRYDRTGLSKPGLIQINCFSESIKIRVCNPACSGIVNFFWSAFDLFAFADGCHK